jgi:ribosomal protein L11 methyltransferase
MGWLEISAEVTGENVEALCSALSEVAPGGCSVEDPVVPLGPEEGVRYEPWRPSVVRAYLPADTRIERRLAEIRVAVEGLPFRVTLQQRLVREDDWANAWKAFFAVERIGRRLVIRPTWRDYEPRTGDVVLDLDPGMAFGTGQHETTRMALVAVEQYIRPGAVVLDVGCGSGILALAAARLGAGAVLAVDIESVAVEAAAANVERNGVTGLVRVAEGSLDERWPFGTLPRAAFDLVLANIHAGAALALAPAARAALRADGRYVTSGIIAERLPEVLAGLIAAGFAEPEVRADGEWRTVVARPAHVAAD